MIEAETPDAINSAIDEGRPCVTHDSSALIASTVDVIIEATGSVEIAARHASAAIAAGKHFVMVTVEGDLVYGNHLRRMAEDAGVLYSAAYGDEPALAFELWDWARALGFRVVAAGKGTRFLTSFRKANPDDVPRLYGFTGSDYNAQMFGSFLDGTKHAIEMCCLSNMSGLVPDIRGMHFPGIDLRDIPDKMCHRSKGGILENEGVVEAVSAARSDDEEVERNLRGGLYAVIDGTVPAIIESLNSYGSITGMITGERSGYAMVYRPQHFIGHEMPLTFVRMMTLGQTCGAPVTKTADVVAVAKRPLAVGTRLDGEGGFTVYGLAERSEIAEREHLVPIGLTAGAEVIADIPEDGMITYDNVRPADSFAYRMLRDQGSL